MNEVVAESEVVEGKLRAEGLVPLWELSRNQSAVVASVMGCGRSAKRLADLGMAPGTIVELVERAILRGPIEIKIRGTNLVLGRGVAHKVWVKRL